MAGFTMDVGCRAGTNEELEGRLIFRITDYVITMS